MKFKYYIKTHKRGSFFCWGFAQYFSGFLYLVHIVVFQGVTARKYLVLIQFKYLSSFMLKFYEVGQCLLPLLAFLALLLAAVVRSGPVGARFGVGVPFAGAALFGLFLAAAVAAGAATASLVLFVRVVGSSGRVVAGSFRGWRRFRGVRALTLANRA